MIIPYDNHIDFYAIVNIIVAASNLAAVPAARAAATYTSFFIVNTAYLGSILMHLSEMKHHLPGVPPYNKSSNEFLALDRFTALLATLWYCFMVWYGLEINYLIAATGLTCLFLSENIRFRWRFLSSIWFMIFHIIWHFCAYYLLYQAVLFENRLAYMCNQYGWVL